MGKNAGLEWNKVCQKCGFMSDPSIPNHMSVVGLLVEYPHGIIRIVSLSRVQTELNKPVSSSKFVYVEVLSMADSDSASATKFYCVSFGGGSVAVYLNSVFVE